MPGTSGILTPFGNIEGLYFNNSSEPDGYAFDFKQDIRKIMEGGDVEYIEIEADNKQDYYKILDELTKFNKNAITISGTSKNRYTVIVENLEGEDVDDTSKTTNEGGEMNE